MRPCRRRRPHTAGAIDKSRLRAEQTVAATDQDMLHGESNAWSRPSRATLGADADGKAEVSFL